MTPLTRVPIRLRVAAAFAVAMTVVLLGTGIFLYTSLSSHLTLALGRDLQVRANDLSVLVRESGGTIATAGNGRFVEHGEAYAQLLRPDGEVVDATRPLRGASLLTASELRRATRGTVFADRASVPGLNEPSRLLAAPVEAQGRRLVLVVGLTRQDRAETLARLRTEMLVAGPVALVLATLAGYLLAGLSLRPVEAMRRRAAAVSADRPGERLPVPRTGDEVQRLGETLNAMLTRLEVALARERDFVADAGHELRRPLALLRTELELALRHAETTEEFREAVQVSSEEAERLAQLAEDLLLIARTEKGELPLRLEPVEPEALFERLASRFEWRCAETGRQLSWEAPPGIVVDGDPLRLEQALGNLVDNALRHGDGPIWLTACRSDGAVELHVLDQGPGFLDSFLPSAFDRFTRPAPDRGGSGAGLGLSIVRAIATAHGGAVGASNRPGAGADVWLSVPVARAA